MLSVHSDRCWLSYFLINFLRVSLQWMHFKMKITGREKTGLVNFTDTIFLSFFFSRSLSVCVSPWLFFYLMQEICWQFIYMWHQIGAYDIWTYHFRCNRFARATLLTKAILCYECGVRRNIVYCARRHEVRHTELTTPFSFRIRIKHANRLIHFNCICNKKKLHSKTIIFGSKSTFSNWFAIILHSFFFLHLYIAIVHYMKLNSMKKTKK